MVLVISIMEIRWEHTGDRRFVMADIPQFQKNGAVPNRALTVGIPRTSWALRTSGKFLDIRIYIELKVFESKGSLQYLQKNQDRNQMALFNRRQLPYSVQFFKVVIYYYMHLIKIKKKKTKCMWYVRHVILDPVNMN